MGVWEDDEAAAEDRAELHEEGDESQAPSAPARRGRAPSSASGARTERGPRKKLGDVEEVPAGRVTAIHERRSGSVRYLVAIDGRPVATVSAELIAELGLRVGGSVDVVLAQRLRAESSRLAVFDKAIDLLAVRARSTRDLQMRLRRAGAADASIAAAIERLQQLGFLDDDAYARNLARSRVLSGGVSRRRIGQELQRRGVSREVADGAIAETLEEVELDEEGAARLAGEKRLRALRSYDAATQKQRLYAFLARRGYAPDVIARVVRDLMR